MMLRQAAPPVTVRVSAGDDAAVVWVSGDLDAATVPALRPHLEHVAAMKPGRLVFDLAGVGFVDCAAARMLIAAGNALPGRPRPVLRSPRPAVRRLLSLAGFGSRCVITP